MAPPWTSSRLRSLGGSFALLLLSGCSSDTSGFASPPAGTGGQPAGGAGMASSAGSAGALGGAGTAEADAGIAGAGAGTAGAGAGGSAGRGGGGGASGNDGAGGKAGAAGKGGAGSGCAGDLLICEDFEGTAPGEVPSGWTRHGNLAAVSEEDAHLGKRALGLGAADSDERRIYHDAKLLGSAHWGRIFYKVQTPVPDAFVHSTMVSLMGNGTMNGRSDYRPIDTVKQAKDTPDVGSRHNWIYNVQIIGKSEFGRETDYDYNFDGMWHCAEYHIDASNQSFAFYWDGEQKLSFENGAGNYDRSDIPQQFDELRVGWINYQSAPPGFTAWIDDIAFDDERIGCQ